MKLSKAMEMLERNNTLEFKSNIETPYCQYSILSMVNNYYHIINYNSENVKVNSANGMIALAETDWQLIEKPISFEELLKIKDLGKKYIKVKYFDCETCYDSLKGIMQYLSETNASNDLIEIIKHGEWYVKESDK